MTATATPVAKSPAPPSLPQKRARNPLLMVVDVLASMKLTVVILLFFGVLTFVGTLAQKTLGLFLVQRDYFESFFIKHDTGFRLTDEFSLKLPLPGGYLLMLLLFSNLMVGGVVRLRWQLRNLGILVTHIGMALLLVAGFVKLHYSYAGHVALYEGAQASSMVSFHDFELALLKQDGTDLVERTMPAAALAGAARGAVTIDDPKLPFVLAIDHWYENCAPEQKGPMFDAPTPVVTDASGVGVYLRPRALAKEREQNQAGCYASIKDRATGEEQRAVLWGADMRPFEERRAPFTFVSGGTTYGLDLRRVTWDLPFAVRLEKFQKTDHPGTMTAADFRSTVSVLDDGSEQRVEIYMNHPLRREGHVFFQTSWGPNPESGMSGPPFYSVFEVASNPSDDWPKWASYVILVGLLLHFVTKLVRYLKSSTHAANTAEIS
ncbi:MAG: cytochrome c biogenesis protein ResB [Planctomycetota bacterium]